MDRKYPTYFTYQIFDSMKMENQITSYPIADFNESPAPWKNKYDRTKSAINIPTREITTAEVVDSPTPFAPPSVVTPQAQLTTAIIPPNTCDFIIALTISQGLNALLAESNIIFILTPYTASARSALDANPTVKHMRVSTGTAMQQARTRGVTR